MSIGLDIGDVRSGEEGLQTMNMLGENMLSPLRKVQW